MTGRPWTDYVPPVTVDVPCSGGRHTMTWDAGRLTAHDHDPEAEAAMEALGGEPPACLEFLAAWDLPNPDPMCVGILTAWAHGTPGRRGAQVVGYSPLGGHAALSAPGLQSFRSIVAARMAAGRQGSPAGPTIRAVPEGAAREQNRRALLFDLPTPLLDRYALGLLQDYQTARAGLLWLKGAGGDWAWSMGQATAGYSSVGAELEVRPIDSILTAKAAPRVIDGLQTWRRMAAKVQHVEVRALEPETDAAIEGEAVNAIADISVRLPVSWLWEVWGRGVACVDGLFTLSVVDEADEDLLRVRAVRWERLADRRSVPVTGRATLCRTRHRWSAVWED